MMDKRTEAMLLAFMVQLREAHSTIEEAAQHFARIAPGLDPENHVDIGQMLWTIIEKGTEIFDRNKEALREQALSQCSDAPGVCLLHGHTEAHCTVSIPPATFRLRPDAYVAALKAKLGSRFGLLFEEP